MQFEHYRKVISDLPSKPKYEKKDLLIEGLLFQQSGRFEIFYSPHNEYVNTNARILILGITPGWSQMEVAIRSAKQYMEMGFKDEELLMAVKRESRFFGSVRKNLITMLNDLGLHSYLNLPSCSELFSKRDDLLHTCSLIKYPLFTNHRNYNGHTSPILNNELLMEYCNDTLQSNILPLKKPFIIPLGKAVESVIHHWILNGILTQGQCLFGFPHPSGANGHRHQQYKMARQEMQNLIQDFFT